MTPKIKLLLVDDEQIIRNAYVRLISQRYPEIEILLAENGIEALARIEAHHPNVMMLDLGMSKMGGLKVLEAMKHANHIVPTLIVSAYDTEELLPAMRTASAQPNLESLKKPVSKSELYAALDRLFARGQSLPSSNALEAVHANTDMPLVAPAPAETVITAPTATPEPTEPVTEPLVTEPPATNRTPPIQPSTPQPTSQPAQSPSPVHRYGWMLIAALILLTLLSVLFVVGS